MSDRTTTAPVGRPVSMPAVELRMPGAETLKTPEAAVLALRPKEAARALGIGVRLLWEKTNCGEIPCVRIGRAVVYPVHLLREWLASRAEGGR